MSQDSKTIFLGFTEVLTDKEGNDYGYSQDIYFDDLKHVIKNYLTDPNAKGQQKLKLKLITRSKSGKPFTTVVDPNDDSYKKYKEQKQAQDNTGYDPDLGF